MNDSINLLVKKDKNILNEQKKLKVFRIISVGSLVVLVLTSLSTFLLNQQLLHSSLEKEKDAVLSEMLPFREKEAKINVVNNRIQNISKVLNKRVDIYKIINTILGKVPDGMFVDSLDLSENKVSIKISSSSLISVDSLFNNLIDMAKRKEIIKDLTLDSLNVSELEGSYKVSINMNI